MLKMNESWGPGFFVCQRECAHEERLTVHSEEDMFEVTTTERQGSALDPGVK